MPAKPIKEPAEAIQIIPPAPAAPVQSTPEPPKVAEETAVKPQKVDPRNLCTFEKMGDLDEELIFEDGSKFKFPTRIFQTADLVLAGKITTVRVKYHIEPRSNDYGRSE